MRYRLATDGSGHWYIIPEERVGDWSTWRDLPEEDPNGWNTPKYAHRLAGSPFNVTFTEPLEFGRPIKWPQLEQAKDV